MNCSIVLIISMLCMYMSPVHIGLVEALPLRADPQILQALPTDSLRDTREAPQTDGESEASSTETEYARSVTSGSGGADNGTVCEPCIEAAERVAEENIRNGNVLYPFSAMAEIMHSQQRRRRSSGTEDVLHRDICNEIEDIANQNLPNDQETPCPWEYECNYREDRFPHYILSARCLTPVCRYPKCIEEPERSGTETHLPRPPADKSCKPYTANYHVLEVPHNDCYGANTALNFTILPVAMGCACTE